MTEEAKRREAVYGNVPPVSLPGNINRMPGGHGIRESLQKQPSTAITFGLTACFSERACVSVAEERQRDGVSLRLCLWMLKLGLDCTVQVAAL